MSWRRPRAFALRLHVSAAPPRGGLTQALGDMSQDHNDRNVYKATTVKLQSEHSQSWLVVFFAACFVSFLFPLALLLPSDIIPQKDAVILLCGFGIWIFSVVKVSSIYGYVIGGNDPYFTLKSLFVVAALSVCMFMSAVASSYIFSPGMQTFSSRHVT
jgi:hypothetical protein